MKRASMLAAWVLLALAGSFWWAGTHGAATGAPEKAAGAPPAAVAAVPHWPPALDEFEPGITAPGDTRIAISLERGDKGELSVVLEATGPLAGPTRAGEKQDYYVALRSYYYFARGQFVGLEQEFDEEHGPLAKRMSLVLEDPPPGADTVVVEINAVRVGRKAWPEEAFGDWFTASWWHFSTAVPTRDGPFGKGEGGADKRVTSHPVDRDLAGWVTASGMESEPGFRVVARLAYPPPAAAP